MKLRIKLIVIPILGALLVFGAVILMSIFSYRRSTLQVLNDNQALLVASMTQGVDEYINKYKDIVMHLEMMDQLKDMSEYDNIQLNTRGLSDQEGIPVRSLFKKTILNYPQFAYLETFTKGQAINVILEPYDAQLNITEEDYLRGFSYRDWYVGAMENKGIYVSEAYVSASIFEPVVAISTPIKINNKPEAIMIGTLRLKELSNRVEMLAYGETGVTYIVDKNHHLVAHPDSTYFGAKELYSIADSEIVRHIQMTEGLSDDTVRIYDSLTGEDVYVHYQKAATTDWYIVSQVSVREVEAPVWRIVTLVSLFSAGLVLAYLIFLYLNTNHFVDALGFLDRMSVNVANGDLHLSEADDAKFLSFEEDTNEIGTLMQSYHHMIGDLGNSFDLLEKTNEEIDFLAKHDPLTQLPNRRSFHSYLVDLLSGSHQGAVIMMDLDNFKLINDTLGHVVGDRVLVDVAERLKRLTSDSLFVSRFGGDEFIICIHGVHSEKHIQSSVEMIREAFEENFRIDDAVLEVKFSLGISRFPEDSNNKNQLVKYADLALYAAKRSGKNHYEFFRTELENTVIQKSNIERELTKSIAEGGFSIVYQPQVQLPSGEIAGYEALIRMKNNAYGPGEFIQVAEETGQIVPIGRWVLEEVIRQQKNWQEQGFDIRPVAVNFSAAQFQDKGFVDFMVARLGEHHLDASYIELEVTENVFIEKLSETSVFLNQLRDVGIRIAIDDFGTGYSTLNYLMSLPASKIKLDRSLSEKFLAPETVQTIISLISLSHSLNMTVVAEGIEYKSDVMRLIEAGCDEIQGYYFSRPLPVEAMADNMRANYSDLIG